MERGLRIKLEEKLLNWGEFSLALEKKKFQLAGLFRRDYYEDPFFYLSFFKEASFNPHGWKNERYENLLEKCTLDPSQQNIREMENFLINESPVIPLINQKILFAAHKRVKNLQFYDNGCLNLLETTLDDSI